MLNKTMSTNTIEVLTQELNALTKEKRLNIACNCLNSFVGANFAGILSINCQELLFPITIDPNFAKIAFNELSFNINTPFQCSRFIELLWIAEKLFFLNKKETINLFEWAFWSFRCHCIWAFIMNEKSLELREKIDNIITNIEAIINSNDNNLSNRMLFEYYLEKKAIKSFYFEQNDVILAQEKAAVIAGFSIELDGVLGRRTRFQIKSVAQLVVSTRSNTSNFQNDEDLTICDDLPLDCKNTDDTLLERVVFDETNSEKQSFSQEQLAYILSLSLQSTRSDTNLDYETAIVFVEEVIHQRKNWAIQLRAFIERSMLERQNSRRVERACSQMEIITKLLDNFDNKKLPENALKNRLNLIYATAPIPFWNAKKIQAEILKSLGCTSESLLIYESLKMWDDVVQCYKSLNQLEKAESLVRDLIFKDDKNPIYYCVLGDITQNIEHYNKAIEISNNRCPRACASLGQLFLCRKQYEKALQNFQQSVKLQPYQIGVWFNLGHCALELKDYKEGVRAFHRCVSFEPEHFEAWNNLAACYVSLNQKERAQKVIQESIKLNHDNYNVWQNLMLISIDISDFKSALQAIKKLLDMDTKRKIDELPLEILVSKTLEYPSDEVKNLRNSIVEILARVVARQSVNSKLLRLYAELKKPSDACQDFVAWSKYIQLLEKAVQCEGNSLESDENFILKLEGLISLIDAKRIEWNLKKLTEKQITFEIKLRVQPIIKLIEKTYGTNCANSNNKCLKEAFKKVLALLI